MSYIGTPGPSMFERENSRNSKVLFFYSVLQVSPHQSVFPISSVAPSTPGIMDDNVSCRYRRSHSIEFTVFLRLETFVITTKNEIEQLESAQRSSRSSPGLFLDNKTFRATGLTAREVNK